MKQLTVALLAVLLIAGSCNKSGSKHEPFEQLPDSTQIGANTLGFIVNGEVQATAGAYNLGTVIPEQFVRCLHGADSVLWINARNLKQGWNLQLQLKTADTGVYYLSQHSADMTIYSRNDGANSVDDIYKWTTPASGYVQLTALDSQIVAGYFSVEVKNQRGASVNLEQGRFDIKK